jgi:8-oxoguanine deaminase
MTTFLVNNIHTLVTMDPTRCEIPNGAIFIRDHIIEQVGTTAEQPQTADETLDLQGQHIVLPGFVNTHHHFFQTLTKAIPAAQNSNLFGWIKTLFPIWANLSAEGLYISTQMAAAALMLSGCTTTSNRH